jgi:hypothetical protein
MMALALAEDSLSKRERCDEIIDELGKLSDKMRSFMQVRGNAQAGSQQGTASLSLLCNAAKSSPQQRSTQDA